MSVKAETKADLIKETKVDLLRTTYYVYQDAGGKVIWPAINFINYVISEKESDSTISTYRQAIRSLFNYLADNSWADMNDRELI
ncbi:site-specific integrase, partial [Vibrio breoganii]